MHLKVTDMYVWAALLFYELIHTVVSYDTTASAPSVDMVEQQEQTLCAIGCKCPEAGKHMTFLDCRELKISKLPSSLVIDSTVTSLSFGRNDIESLKMNTFSKADEVQKLDFSLNLLSNVDNYTFTPFTSLTSLRLEDNRLSKLTPGMLNGLWNLTFLNLRNNVIQELSYLSFEETPNLQELWLHHNPLFVLPENTFRYLPNLEKLVLDNTRLVMLPSNLFLPTPRLHWLSLADNGFENVPEEALSHASQLEFLDLSMNDFTILVEGAFRRLSSISVLKLNGLGKLLRIEKDALAGLKRLRTFICSFNANLSYIDENVFGSDHSNISNSKTPPNETLYLNNNALRSMKSPLELQSWSSLRFIDLSGNPWKCDCNLLWMLQLNRRIQKIIECDSPGDFHGRTLDTIEPSELICNGSWLTSTFVIMSCMVAFGAVALAVSAGLYVRAKMQYSYNKVQLKTESLD